MSVFTDYRSSYVHFELGGDEICILSRSKIKVELDS